MKTSGSGGISRPLAEMSTTITLVFLPAELRWKTTCENELIKSTNHMSNKVLQRKLEDPTNGTV